MAGTSLFCLATRLTVYLIYTLTFEAGECFEGFYKLRPEILITRLTASATVASWHRLIPLTQSLMLATGAGWLDDANELQKLSAFENNAEFLDKMDAAREKKRSVLAAYVKDNWC